MGGNVQQSGNVTPGHLAKWTSSGVISDAGPLATNQRVLAYLQGADFNSVQDQPLIVPGTVTAFQLTGIIICNASIPISAAVGGFYPALSKGGIPIVAASQVYSSLTTSSKLLQATLSAFGLTTRFSSPAVLTDNYVVFSLTTPQNAPCTADIYLVGVDLTIG